MYSVRTCTCILLQFNVLIFPTDPPVASFDSKIIYSPPVDLVMENFQQHKAEDKCWTSPPFTTHQNGYQMCLRVFPNGYGPGRNTHLAVGAFLMKGENDDHLSWPLRATLRVQLINQKQDKQHVECTIEFSDVFGDEYCGRVVSGIVTDVGMLAHFGIVDEKFIELAELLTPSDQTCYLHHNKVRFRIKQAVIYTSRVPSKMPHWATSPGKYIAELTMTNFQKHCEVGDEWASPPFFCDDGGYKLCIAVYANGKGNGTGSHVSVYIHIMSGPNDDHLKWPFEARITVQMINWKHDRNHVQHTIDIDRDTAASQRVMDDLKFGGGTGLERFISHEELLDTTSEDTLYIEDDTIKFRIVDVQCWGKAASSPTGMSSIHTACTHRSSVIFNSVFSVNGL